MTNVSKRKQQAENKPANVRVDTVKLVLTAEQFNVIMAALGEIPHKVAQPVVAELVTQVQPQVKTLQTNPTPA